MAALLRPYGLAVRTVPSAGSIPGSYWGESEAGIRGTRLHIRADTPLHFSAFSPRHRMRNLPRTPTETLELARRIALDQGARVEDVADPDDGRIRLIDADGIVRWRNLTENWRVRVRPDSVIEALAGLGVIAGGCRRARGRRGPSSTAGARATPRPPTPRACRS